MHERTDDQADIPEEEGSEQGPHDTAAEGESPASSFGPVCITACFGFQPDVRWGLFLALPIWGPWSNLGLRRHVRHEASTFRSACSF